MLQVKLFKTLTVLTTLILSFTSFNIPSQAATNVWSGFGSPNTFGKGDGDFLNPMVNSDITGVSMVSSGRTNTLFLKTDGTVWSSGANTFGQNGIGATSVFSTLSQVTGLTGVTHINQSVVASYAVKSDGTVWSWGQSTNGRLGYSQTTNQLTPKQIPGLTGVSKVEAGAEFAIALKTDGTVWTWGANNYGQLGNGNNTDSATPAQVSGLIGITAIEANANSAYALNGSGQVYAWGQNLDGSLSDGVFPSSDKNVPTLTTLTNVAKFGNMLSRRNILTV